MSGVAAIFIPISTPSLLKPSPPETKECSENPVPRRTPGADLLDPLLFHERVQCIDRGRPGVSDVLKIGTRYEILLG